MFFMLCGQHLILSITARQFEDPPIARRPKEQDRRDSPEMPTRQHSASEVSTECQTGIVLGDDIVECTSDPGNTNNGEDVMT